MTSLTRSGNRNTHSLRAGLVAAVLAVTACFGAAIGFTDAPAQAAEMESAKQAR